jgi:hypothetical protein
MYNGKLLVRVSVRLIAYVFSSKTGQGYSEKLNKLTMI